MSYSHLQRCLYTPGCTGVQYTVVKTADGFATICRRCWEELQKKKALTQEARALIGSGFEKT